MDGMVGVASVAVDGGREEAVGVVVVVGAVVMSVAVVMARDRVMT